MQHPADALTERLGLPIQDRDLFAQALVHSSWLHEHPDAARGHNERLEFLGDAVVSIAVSEALFRRHPTDDEGVLSALAPRTWAPRALASRRSEEGLEDVAESAEAALPAAERRVVAAEVVARTLIRVAEHVVGVRHELEPFGRVRARVHVGVQFACEAAVRLLDLVRRRVARDAEHLVVVSHNRLPVRAQRGIVWSQMPRQRALSSSSSIRVR